MSMVITRSPLEAIGMNGTGSAKRRSGRLSQEGGENEPPAKKTRVNGASATISTTDVVSTKQADGDINKSSSKRKPAVYDQEIDDFAFTKGKRKKPRKATEDAANPNSAIQDVRATAARSDSKTPVPEPNPNPTTVPEKETAPPTQRKKRNKLPETPEKTAPEPVRRSKRLSNEHDEPQPLDSARTAQVRPQANAERSPSPALDARPVTVEKKRKQGVNGGVEEEKVMRIVLPFADTPIIRRNREMRKNSAENHRRSSAGMRGRRASSLIDEGRGHALPHAEVEATDFYKHISEDLTEPRRMRCLLGWCSSRALPPKNESPNDETNAVAKLGSQTLQIARTIQEQLSQDLITNGTLSDWFSRDESTPLELPRKKKPNPRNVANAAKAEELERELARLQLERAEWDAIVHSIPAQPDPSALSPPPPPLSPLRADLLSTPQRDILSLLQPPEDPQPGNLDEPTPDLPNPLNLTTLLPSAIHTRLQTLSTNLEFTIDQFAHGVHALSTARDTAERIAEKSLADAAAALEQRARDRARADGKPAATDPLDALKGLAKVLNARR